MSNWYYLYSGLRVVSNAPIPEWNSFEQSQRVGDAVDVMITIRAPRASSDMREASADATPDVAPDEWRFHIPETGDYYVHHGCEIVVTPVPGAGEREVRLVLLTWAWSGLCYQRGILALHSSVVQAYGERSESIGDGALAFCGWTGMGKSSVVAWLMAHGYRLVSDDLCRFALADGVAHVYPAAPRLKLWRDSLDALGWGVEGLERDHFRADKFDVTAQRGEVVTADSDADKRFHAAAAPLPVRAIYLLEWGEPGIVRLTGMNALRRLVAAATYQAPLLEPMGQVAAHWERCAKLAASVPIFQFTRPRDWAALDAAMEMLSTHWQNAGNHSRYRDSESSGELG